jgi:MFS transporter, DHA2 family, multidrug resistance protein
VRDPLDRDRPRTPVSQSGAPHRFAITVSVMAASILQALDTTIANVALPHIRGSLSATLEQMGWVLTSYIVAAAIMTPLSGWLASRYGRKRVLLYSVAGFTIASALCGLSQSLLQIVLCRLLQGVCGAALIPLSQAVLLDINPPEQQGRASATWGMGVLIGPIIGPLLGGWLTDNYSWRWVFYINIPFGILSLLGMMTFMRESATRRSPFDFVGFASLSLAVGALQLVLDRGQLRDWFSSTEICVYALIGGLAFYVFMVQTLTAAQPFIRLSLFKDRNFTAGSLVMLVMSVVMMATLALQPSLLQDIMGYPVTLTGVVTSPRGVGAFLTMVVVGRLIGRVDARIIVATGLVFMALSAWEMTGLSAQMDDQLIVVSGFLQGIGTGLAWAALSAVTFTTLVPALRNEGTALFNLMRNVGGSVGIAVTQTLLTRHTQMLHARLAEHVTAFRSPWQAPGGYDIASSHGLAALNARVTHQAALIAYNNDFRLLFFVTLAVIPLVLALRSVRPQSAPREVPE